MSLIEKAAGLKVPDLKLGPAATRIYELLSPDLKLYCDGLVSIAFAQGVSEAKQEDAEIVKNAFKELPK